jgi:phage head maturation protease
MMDTKAPTPVKAMCETEVKSIEDETRSLSFTISTNKVDRSLDSINPDGWDLEAYKKNPVVLWAHDSTMVPPAKAVDIGVVDGRLRAKTVFVPKDNPAVGAFAEGIFQLYKGGFLNATSVGFLPIEMNYSDEPSRKGGLNFTKQELMEFSLVPVPANSEALLEGKAAGIDVSPVIDCYVQQIKRCGSVEALLEIRKVLSADDLRAFAELVLEETKGIAPIVDDAEKKRRAYERRKRQLDVIRIKGNR